MNSKHYLKLKVSDVPEVYYDQETSAKDYNKYTKEVNPFTDNILINGGNQQDRIVFMLTMLKSIINAKPGAAFFRFENMIEHFRQNQYLELLKSFRGKRYIAIDNMDFNYIGGDWNSSNVFKRFCSFLREVYESASRLNIIITTPHKDNVLENNIPKFLYNIFETNFETIKM